MAEEKPRDASLDLIRVVAIALVVLLHANAGQFLQPGDGWWISNALNSATRVCVPLFIIISGALLIPRQEPIRRHLQRAFKMATLIVIWSYIYAAWVMISGEGFGFLWDKRITTLLDPTIPIWIARTPMMTHLPFLYGLVVFYLFLPILQAVYSSPRGRVVLTYFAAICLAFSSLATVNAASGVSWVFLPGIEAFTLFAGYAAFGAIAGNYKPDARSAIALGLLFVGVTALTSFLNSLISQQAPNEMFGTYWSPTVALASCFAYLLLRGVQVPEIARGGVTKLAGLSFGVYFIHMVIMGKIIPFVWSHFSDERVTNVLLTAALSYLLSIAIVSLINSNRLTRLLIS